MKQEEQRLQALLSAADESNRFQWAMRAKQRGKMVIGVDSYYVPEEIIYAAGMFPWRLAGNCEQAADMSTQYWHPSLSLHCGSVLESVLRGQMDFLDGAVVSDYSEDSRRMGDILRHLGKPRLVFPLHVPFTDAPRTRAWFAQVIRDLRTELEGLSGNAIGDSAIAAAIEDYNKMRSLVRQLYELRTRDVPPLNGTEFCKIALAAVVMDKREFSEEIDSLLPYLGERQAPVSQGKPRILLSSDNLFEPRYVELIERAGCLVAMDDLEPGARYFWQSVNTDGNAIDSLAQRYLSQPAAPRVYFYEEHVDRLVEWVRKFRIDGVINLHEVYDTPRVFGGMRMAERLSENGTQNIALAREYRVAGEGQLLTRVQAFLETCSS